MLLCSTPRRRLRSAADPQVSSALYWPLILAGSLAGWHSPFLVHGLGLGVSRAHAVMQAGVTAMQLTTCLRRTHCHNHLVPAPAELHPQRSCCLCWQRCRRRASRRRRRWPQHRRSCCSCQHAARVRTSRTTHVGAVYRGCCRRCRVRVHQRPGYTQHAELPVVFRSILPAIQALHAVRQLCTVWRDAH